MKNKNTALVDQYARFLDETDVIRLFEKLEDRIGNLQEAAKECNITRKTVYDWKTLTHEIKLETKEKILDQSLEKLRIETLEFLTKKMTDIVAELLYNFLLTVYKSAFDCKDLNELDNILKRFEDTKQRYAGILYNRFEYEVSDLSEKLEEYVSMSKPWVPAPFYLYSIQAVNDIVKEVVNSVIYPLYSESPEKLAIRLRIPVETITQATRTLPIDRESAEPRLYGYTGTGYLGQEGISLHNTSGATWLNLSNTTGYPQFNFESRGLLGNTTVLSNNPPFNKYNKMKSLVLSTEIVNSH